MASCVTLAAVGVSLLQPKSYAARAQVLLQPPTSDPLQNSLTAADAQRQLNNETRQMQSTAARNAVRATYTGPLDVSDVSASVAAGDADVIYVSVKSSDAQASADLVNHYVERYIEFRRTSEVESLLASATLLRERLAAVQTEYSQVNSPIATLDARIATETSLLELDRLRAERARVLAQIGVRLSNLQSQISFYQEQLDRVELSANLRKTSALSILHPAEVPDSPVSPNPARNAVLGLLCGLILGAIAAIVKEQLDDTLRAPSAIESTAGLPILAQVPTLQGKRQSGRRGSSPLVAFDSVGAESFRVLRTATRFIGVGDTVRVVQITSASPGEGKTTITANLAASIAQTGAQVLVVGADLRNPRLEVLFGAPPGPGLSSVLLGDADADEAIWSHPSIPRLSVMRTGPLPTDPSEVLGSARAQQLLDELAAVYDVILMDTAPILPVADSLALVPFVQATILVANRGSTSHAAFQRCCDQLRQIDAPLVGVIINNSNRVEREQSQSYAYTANSKQRMSEPKIQFQTRTDVLRNAERSLMTMVGDEPSEDLGTNGKHHT